MPSPQIAMQQVGLGGVLKQYRVVVPPNQREYSWEEEVQTLFEDLTRAIADGDDEYFLGTVVTIPRAPDILEVVDGQQRLATSTILLAEIRNYLLVTEPLIAESVSRYLVDIDRPTRERIPKLQLNTIDNDYFRTMLTREPTDPQPEPLRYSNRLIRDAFEAARKHVRNIVAGSNPKDHGNMLDRWVTFIEHSAEVILLKVPSAANAYKMFETLNARGLPTSQSDLVKNYLFGQSGARLNEAQEKWSLMRGALESLDEDDITVTFLRHALIASHGHLRETEVYDTVQGLARGPQQTVILLTRLESLATSYVAIFNPEQDKWNSYPDTVRQAIRTLKLFNIRPMRPLMLAIAARFSEKETAAAFQAFIAWGVRLVIAASTRSGSVELPFSAAAHAVFTREIKDTKSLRDRLRAVIPNDQQFQQAFEIATVSKASLARYYLRSLERTAKGEPNPYFTVTEDREVINLEHVLPERREDGWPQFDDETAAANVRRIGNLALLRVKPNSDLKSKAFHEKLAVYTETPYELTRQISTVADWTAERIAERQKGLAALAVKTWPA